MVYDLSNIKFSIEKLKEFKSKSNYKFHERYFFPYLCGTYFTYRKIDTLRISRIADSLNKEKEKIKYVDVGCGNGDFLEKIREFIPNAKGIEKNINLFYSIGRSKPKHIDFYDTKYGLDEDYDLVFVGWMDPGEDFRDEISMKTDIVITTLDQGLSLAAEYEGHGYEKLAEWITPSWEDVNFSLANKYYSGFDNKLIKYLSDLRGSHNYWYIYCKNEKKSGLIKEKLMAQVESEKGFGKSVTYEFEQVLDDLGFGFLEKINDKRLWEIKFF